MVERRQERGADVREDIHVPPGEDEGGLRVEQGAGAHHHALNHLGIALVDLIDGDDGPVDAGFTREREPIPEEEVRHARPPGIGFQAGELLPGRHRELMEPRPRLGDVQRALHQRGERREPETIRGVVLE